jgi:predicted nucleic acid-binding protein
MVLVDTCGWIEWMTDSALAESYGPHLGSESLLVPTLVQHELYKWLCREVDTATALAAIAASEQAKVVPLDTSLALLAADVGREHGLAMADAIIYATARQYGATVVTSDKHFEALPHVLFYPKK